MRLLLDTHVWVWSLVEPERLGASALRLLEDEGTELWLSPVSAWEAHLLMERGRLPTEEDPRAAIRRMLEAGPFREAPLVHSVALESRAVRLPHPDPADRFIVATARVYELTLMTADRRLLESGECAVVEARG